MSLNRAQIANIAHRVYREFPDLIGLQPEIKAQKTLPGGAEAARYLLTFSARKAGPGGRAIVRVVRVVADGNGKIVKLTTSR